MELIVLACLLAASLLGHATHAFYLLRSRSRLVAAAKDEAAKARKLSIEAEELLQDLVSQGAIVKIERINPDHLFMWRPR